MKLRHHRGDNRLRRGSRQDVGEPFLENVFRSDNNTSVMAHIGSTISLGCQVKKEAQFGVVSNFS